MKPATLMLALLFSFIMFIHISFSAHLTSDMLNKNSIKEEVLDLSVGESVSTSKSGVVTVTDTYVFTVPEFELDKDVRLEPINTTIGKFFYRIEGKKPAIHIFLGAFKSETNNVIKVHDTTLTNISINGIKINEFGFETKEPERGWANLAMEDDILVYSIFVQPPDLILGGRNKLQLTYRLNNKNLPQPYYAPMYLELGHFDAVLNATSWISKKDGDIVEITYDITNRGVPKYVGEFKIELWSEAASSTMFLNAAEQNPYNLSFYDSHFIGFPMEADLHYFSYFSVASVPYPFIVGNSTKMTVKMNFGNFSGSKLEDYYQVIARGNMSIIPLFSYDGYPATFLKPLLVDMHDQKLNLVFVPVNWKKNRTDFTLEAKSQYMYLLYSLPTLHKCPEKLGFEMTENGLIVENLSSLSAKALFNKIQTWTLQNYGDTYDYIIAIGDDDSFSPNVAGYTLVGRPIVFVRRGNPITTAHELGHQFGLYDEYCDCAGICNVEPNPLKKEYGCDPNGDCCWSDFNLFGWEPFGNNCDLGSYENYGCRKCCRGNNNSLGGISIMSWANAKPPRYHDDVSLAYLAKNETLRCD